MTTLKAKTGPLYNCKVCNDAGKVKMGVWWFDLFPLWLYSRICPKCGGIKKPRPVSSQFADGTKGMRTPVLPKPTQEVKKVGKKDPAQVHQTRPKTSPSVLAKRKLALRKTAGGGPPTAGDIVVFADGSSPHQEPQTPESAQVHVSGDLSPETRPPLQ